MNQRIIRHAKTVESLSKRGAKVVLIAHQGRPGDPDFVNLKKHAELLSNASNVKVRYVPYIDDKVVSEIKGMNDGDVILVENVRFVKEEMLSPENAEYVKHISDVSDAFVLDALSVAHRRHASVVSFASYLPCYAGPVLLDEISMLERLENSEKITLVFGGAKSDDVLSIIKKWLPMPHVSKILVGGKVGFEIMLGHYSLMDIVDKSHLHKLVLPVDGVVYSDGRRNEVRISERDNIDIEQLKDIGSKTYSIFSNHILDAKAVFMNGPMGIYEDSAFRDGTCAVLNAVSSVEGLSIIGGGHTISAAEVCGIRMDAFTYVSLSGKALIKFLEGKVLPGLEVLGYYEGDAKTC